MKLIRRKIDRKLIDVMLREGSALDAFECIEEGADLTQIDVNGLVKYCGESMPLLSAAAAETDLNLMKALIYLGADVNKRDAADMTPLMYAVYPFRGDKKLEAAKILIEKGADVCAYKISNSNVHESVLMFSAYYADVDLVEYLLENAAGKSVIKQDVEIFEERLKGMDALGQPTQSYEEIRARYVHVLDLLKAELAKNEKEKESESQVEM